MRTISLLETLSKPELTRFGKYLKSPFFSNKPHLYDLFQELREAERNTAITPAAHFARVFPDEPFDGHKWSKALSDLNACIKNFLVVSHLQANQDLYGQALVSACSERVNEPGLQRAVGAVLRQLPGYDAPEQMDSWHLRFWSRKRALTHPQTNRIKLGSNTLDELEQDLDTYYQISKTQLMCNRISGVKVLNWQEKLDSPRQWLETVRTVATERPSPLLKVYCDLLALLLDAGVDLPAFFSTLQRHAPQLHPDELRDTIRIAFNECIHRQRKGDQTAFHWHLKIFRWSKSQGLWDTPKAEELFLNIGVMLAKANLHDEFSELLGAGSDCIPPGRRAEAATLLTAYWAFARSNFNEAQILLQQVGARHPRYGLLRHSVAVRNAFLLFQQGGIGQDVVNQALNNFSDFLRYQKNLFSKNLCQSYKNLIGFIRHLVQTDPRRKATKASLHQTIRERPPAARDWVEAVMDKLPD